MVSTAIPPREKLEGYEFYRKVLRSPKYIVAPMVDQSEPWFNVTGVSNIDQTIWSSGSFPFTLILYHIHLTNEKLVYTPMINAKMFMDTTHKHYREQYFDIASGEEGSSCLASTSTAASSSTPKNDTDRPLIVQFCANSPEYLLQAAKLVEDHCDAVDINLGCPQEIAKRGHYGSFLQDEWELIFSMINTLHKNLAVPVTAKFRVFPDIDKTVEYAKMLERAGAQIITCHGRTREQRGQNSGLASYAHIAAVKAAVSIPVFANGNILFSGDIDRCLAETGADAIMSAEGVLYNPALFNGLPASVPQTSEPSPPLPLSTTNPPSAALALEYLAIVRAQRTRTSPSAVKGHLFKILRPALARKAYHDLREQIGKVRVVAPRTLGKGEDAWVWVDAYVGICEEVQSRLEEDAKNLTDGGKIPLEDLVTKDEATGLDLLPHWSAQPYFRPIAPPVEKKKKGAKVEEGRPRQGKDKEDVSSQVEQKVSDKENVPGTNGLPEKRSADDADVDPALKKLKLDVESRAVAAA
ncbi:hypothetical protein DXG01_007823 [Tephrocybe rancida]|nr:hypothetical protein DXG01_007823 [Tephrocybe rancida]